MYKCLIQLLSVAILSSGCGPAGKLLSVKPGQAEYDANCDYLDAMPPKLKVRAQKPEKYFDKDIPKVVHQIWFGPPKAGYEVKTAQWREFAKKFGYNYRLWTEADLPQIRKFVKAENLELIEEFMRRGNFWSVSDILRLELLSQQGGVYADFDVAPPSDEGGLLDLEDVMPMRGLILVTESNGRTIGNSSLFVCNNFMASSPGHPLITYLVAHFQENVNAWQKQCPPENKACNDSAMYQTGPFYVSRALTGVVSVLPISFTHALNMTDEDK